MSNDRNRNHDRNEGGGDRGGRERGSGDTAFLDLEISKVLYSEAEDVTREAFRELLKDAAKERLRESFGDRIDALAALSVDELLADLEANVAVEDRIADRSESAKDAVKRARAIVRGDD